MKRDPGGVVMYALFDSATAMEAAFNDLTAAGIPVENISLMMSEEARDRAFRALEHHRTKEGVAAGTAAGVTLGWLMTGFTAIGATFAGIGLLAVGPLVALAAAGGIIGGLIGHGMPEERTRQIHEAVHAGKSLMAVNVADSDQAQLAREIFVRHAADTIQPGVAISPG